MNDQSIKAIVPSICPHCSQEILISYQMTPPITNWVLKRSDIEQAKEKLKNAVETIKFKKAKNKEEILEWLNNEETMFGFEDVDSIIDQLIKDNE